MTAKFPEKANHQRHVSDRIYNRCRAMYVSEVRVLPVEELEASTDGPVPKLGFSWLPITQFQ